MISVLHFSNTLARGGVEEHILLLLRGLDRKAFRLYLACPACVLNQIRADIPDDVEAVPIELVSFRSIGAAFQLARLLRSKRIHILHVHMFQSSLLASPIAKLCRVPVVIETPHIREHWRRGWLKGRFVVDRLVSRAVDHYIAVSEANAAYLKERKRLPPGKVTHIRQGSDLRRFRERIDPARSLKPRLGFSEEDPILLIVGRLEPQKGHGVLFEALQRVITEVPRVRLVCLGAGSLRTKLERHADELGIRDSVRFVGYQSDVRQWLALADISILPSFYEGLPLAAIESIAAGCPVVATAVDGTPEVIIDGKTGLTVQPGNPESLAIAICRLLRDPELRSQMSRNGRTWAEQFSAERLVQCTQDLYVHAWENRTSGKRSGSAPVRRLAVARRKHEHC